MPKSAMKCVKKVITSELDLPGMPYIVMKREWWSTMNKKWVHLEGDVMPFGLGLGTVSR